MSTTDVTAVARSATSVAVPERRPARVWRIDIPNLTAGDLFPLKWQLYLSIVGLAIGVAQGFVQAMERWDAGTGSALRLYDRLPLSYSYYQGLTLHGVALAFVFTFCFANSFTALAAMRGFNRPLYSRTLSNVSMWLAWGGTGLAVWAILVNQATVLFTFYAPLKATPAFYLGAVFLVVSTWVTLLNQLLTLREWRRDNPGQRTPLFAFMAITTNIMWFLASLGVAVQVLAFILPWAFGITDLIDPQFTRTLFWFTGHPIVYFWLLPAYMSWYMVLPALSKGRLHSDGLVRVVFIAFLVLLPVGVHHQFTDPGISISSKTTMWLLTLVLFMPSVITAFSVIAALENGARSQGGRGWLMWIGKLPWKNPVVSGQLLAGLAFFLGGMSGLVNASNTVNKVVHNTSFVVGHFHLTVGTAVALTIMASAYWMVPYFTGKALWRPQLAVLQTWLWFLGVLGFSRGQMMGGLEGMPRRTQIASAVYLADNNWDWANIFTAIGGAIMFVSGVLFVLVIAVTLLHRQRVTEPQQIPQTEVIYGPERSWPLLDKIWLWAAVAVVLTAVVYGEVMLHYFSDGGINNVSPTIVVW